MCRKQTGLVSLNPLHTIVNLPQLFTFLGITPLSIIVRGKSKICKSLSCQLADRKKEYAFKHVVCNFLLKQYFWLKIKFAILAKVIWGYNARQRL